ncbi:MAG: response regulator [Planctomycetes bacterium]|nr:response regulator [Planctomycetota bacterium]
MAEISRRILLVDDDTNFLSALQRRLRKTLDITVATSGHEGLGILRRGRTFAVIGTDYRMPGMDGIRFLHEARRISPESVALMLTGCAELDVAVAALHEGAISRFLSKPCPLEVLETTLADCLDKYRSSVVERILRTELAETNDELHALNQSLRAAYAEAQAASQAKSAFLTNMSHELRTPLNSIIGFADVLMNDRDEPLGPKQAERLGLVYRNARNLLTLVNDLLDLSKIEADQLSIQQEPVDIAEVVHECVASARALVRGKLVDLIELAGESLPVWTGDSVRLRQIITNLLSNAAKFTETGSITVGVSENSGFILVTIEDTGVGIAPEDLTKVFERFEQVDASSTRRADGTGLGLAISRKLCELMAGEISVKSKPGVGSCFTLHLPIAAPKTPTAPSRSGPVRERNSDPVVCSGEAE